MAVAFDAKPTNRTANAFDVSFSAATSANLTTLTVGSGSNRALIAAIFWGQNTPGTHSATWDSGGTNQAMTLIGTKNNLTGGVCSAALYGLLNPISGNKTLAFSWSGSTAGYATAISWTGVDQASAATSFRNFNSANTTANPSQITITTASGNATVEYGGNLGSATPSGTNNTLWSWATDGSPNQWSNYALSSSGTAAYSQTISATDNNIEIGCDIAAVVTGFTVSYRTGLLIGP